MSATLAGVRSTKSADQSLGRLTGGLSGWSGPKASREISGALRPVPLASEAPAVVVVAVGVVAVGVVAVSPGAAADGRGLLLVVLLLHVDVPDVVGGPGGDVLHREHGRVHGVVLVVVAVHAVAPDRDGRWGRSRRSTHASASRWPCSARRRRGTPWAPAPRSPPRPTAGETRPIVPSSVLARATRSSSVMVQVSSPSNTKYSEAEAGAALL